MQIFDMAQYSPEWWEARRGIPTASNFDKILTPGGRLSKSADDYACELVGELLSFEPNFFTERQGHTDAMRNGIDCEPEARRFYELVRETPVRQVGFCVADDGRFGCSPDGLVGEEGGLELKCPLLKTQLRYLLDGGLPADYKPQVHGSLIVTGRQWWDFLSFAPGADALLLRVYPDEYTEQLRAALEAFWPRFQEIKGRFVRPERRAA